MSIQVIPGHNVGSWTATDGHITAAFHVSAELETLARQGDRAAFDAIEKAGSDKLLSLEPRKETNHWIERTENGFPVFGIRFFVGDTEHTGEWNSNRPLLSANSKLRKLPGRAGQYRAIGLALAPANYSGRELCPWRTDGCTVACNGFWSGMNVTISTRQALIGRAILWNYHRDLFVRKLRLELDNFRKLCKRTGKIPAVRLNVSTDIVWERILPELFADFPDIQFYDYTKALPKHRPTLPGNYTLCHSFNERTKTADVESIISAGRNVVIAFDSAYAPARKLWGALPESVEFSDDSGREFTLPVINADRHDIRIPAIDGRGVVQGLHGKSGRNRVDNSVASGFMLHHAEGQELRAVSRFVGVVKCHR
jgi:hypothetical protein